MSDLIKVTNELKALLTDERLKIPDKYGTTALLAKAKQNSELNPLSPEKKFQEEVVCNLVKYFNEFSQIHFSELESYIMVSEFSCNKILETFKNYVLNSDQSEDIVFKACVARTVQHLDKSSFSLSYIKNRFKKLKELDPWLFAELIIECNWEEGVKSIKEQLKTNYDASYLFSLLPSWMQDEKKHDDISHGLSEWYEFLNEDDKQIADYYAKNYGYKIENGKSIENEEFNTDAVKGITETDSFRKFVESNNTPKFESLSC